MSDRMHPIAIPMEDELVHGPWNNYYCGIAGCPCSYWPGSMMSIERTTQKLQAIAKRSDPTPTEVLPAAPKVYQSLIGDDEETWRVQAPRRRRRSWWRRLWRW